MKVSPKQIVNYLKSVVGSVYKEGVDQILSWPQTDERGYLKFRFRGGIQVYDCEISPEGIISYIEAQRSDSILLGTYFGPIAQYIEDSTYAQGLIESEVSRIDGKKCRVGKSCGNTCISVNSKCSQMLGLKQKQVINNIREAVSQKAEKSTNNTGRNIAIAAGIGATVLAGGAIAGGAILLGGKGNKGEQNNSTSPLPPNTPPEPDSPPNNPPEIPPNTFPAPNNPPQVEPTVQSIPDDPQSPYPPYKNTFRDSFLEKVKNPLSDTDKLAINRYVKSVHDGVREGRDKLYKFFMPKTMKIKQEIESNGQEVSLEEAKGLACYLTGYPFGRMTAVLRSRSARIKGGHLKLDDIPWVNEEKITRYGAKQYVSLNVGATKALEKLPPPTPERIKKAFPGFSVDGKLRRHMNISDPEALQAFLGEHTEGSKVTYPSFTATTVFSDPNATKNLQRFSKEANVVLLMRPKQPSQTKARLVDHFKNVAVEGELLYPPGTGFKIAKRIEKTVNGVKKYTLFMEED